jgi:hypothetical protein
VPAADDGCAGRRAAARHASRNAARLPAPKLLGHLALGFGRVVLRPIALDLFQPSLKLGLDRPLALEVDRLRLPPQHVAAKLDGRARRLRLDQPLILLGKLTAAATPTC